MRKLEKKILLIEPPFYRLYKNSYSINRYPLSLGYLAGTIKSQTDWDILVYNADFYPANEFAKTSYLAGEGFNNYLNNLKRTKADIWEDTRKVIAEYAPSVVGITAKSQTFASACNVAKIVKEINNQTVVIVGGPHPSMAGPEVLDCPDIDICVRGEGEMAIVELLDTIVRQKEPRTVKGVVYRYNDEIIANQPRELIKDLDSLCFPAESAPQVLKDYDKYPKTAFNNIFAIRGCPYNCSFCGSRNIWGRKPRFRSPQNVVHEIKLLQNRGLKSVHFDDDTFGVNKKYIKELCDAISRDCPGLKWSCEIHVKLVDDETISMMRSSGCYSIQLGIESGSNHILKEIRKNITIEEAKAASMLIKKHGIDLEVFFMIGFPQETEETLLATTEAMKTINYDVILYSIFTPYPYTDMFDYCNERHLIPDDYDISLYNHQSPLNYFCIDIPQKRFRELARLIEKMVDRKNFFGRIRRVFSMNTFWRIQEIGLHKALIKGGKILTGK